MFWLVWIILVGLIAGWATGKIMKGSGYGPLIDILLGIAGAIIGGFILRILGFYTSGGIIPEILVAIFGAVVLVWLARKIK
ncbi:MAG: GlsB/YeaQ/YmgE family stress response membrane protein [Acidobacteria bacterium]|nr:MAG: GlsB/YeaQ/YmgE family stress response membrane protein [Acidobacteriota bacterium]